MQPLLLQRGSSRKSLSSIDLIFRLDRYLEKTIRSAVEQHLFDVHCSGGQSSEDSESGTSSASSNVSARQRRRHHKEQEEARRNRDMEVIDKENIPSGFSNLEDCILTAQEVEKLQDNSGYLSERNKPKRQKSSTKLSELNDNQDSPVSMESFSSSRPIDRTGPDDMEVLSEESKESESGEVIFRHSQVVSTLSGNQKNFLYLLVWQQRRKRTTEIFHLRSF
uniref:Family with sequence similarity 13 member A n=1 Tax=Anas platyrhynchos platyrhynchos TaxID=8840 RepID=A0A493TQ00_ANAPP